MGPTTNPSVNTPVRVLIVDDAPLMRKAIQRILTAVDGIEVVGMASNGQECLKMISQLRPDVVTLDIDMPVMNGITTVKNIMIRHQVPVVTISSLVHDGYFAFEALRLGVMDFLPKPSHVVGHDWEDEEDLVRMRVRMAAGMHVHRMRRVRRRKKPDLPIRRRSAPRLTAVVMGTTLAGPNTIMHIASRLSPDFPAAIIAIQEIHTRILEPFCSCFNEISPIEVVPVTGMCPLEPGKIFMASTFNRIQLGKHPDDLDRLAIHVIQEGEESPIDLLFKSAARHLGEDVCGVLLTGVGTDGVGGMREIGAGGGLTVAQEQQCCVYPNLVECAMEHNVVGVVAPTQDMAGCLESWVRERFSGVHP